MSIWLVTSMSGQSKWGFLSLLQEDSRIRTQRNNILTNMIIYDLLSKVWILCKFSDLTITQNIIGYTATVATVFGATTKRTTTKYDTSVKS